MNVIARVDQMLAGASLTEERSTKPVDVDNEEIVVNSLETLSQRHRRELCEETARLEIERASERAAEERPKESALSPSMRLPSDPRCLNWPAPATPPPTRSRTNCATCRRKIASYESRLPK